MKTNNDYSIIQPDQDMHIHRIGQLCADTFSEGKYVEQYCDNYIGNSNYDWNTSRVILDSEKMIHHWGVWGYQMRLESEQLKVAGIGAVATHPDYRKQGLMHVAAQESFAAMQKDGYDISILRGRHYVKMGYARAWNYIHYNIKPEDITKVKLQKPYQQLTVEQIGEVESLYNHAYSGISGTAIRPTYLKKHPDDLHMYGWFDEQGKLEGYIRAMPDEENPKEFQCVEAVGDPLQGLAVLAELYQGRECEKLTCFTLPYLHPMLQYLRKGAVIVEDRYFDISGWRVRIINLHRTLTKLIPLIERRLVESRYANWQGSLLLDAGFVKASINMDRGRVEITEDGFTENVICGGADTARLLIGSDEPDEIIRQAGMECNGLSVALARVLFPNLHPIMSLWDEF
jgi:predicted N-acetyltransferase YhbS